MIQTDILTVMFQMYCDIKSYFIHIHEILVLYVRIRDYCTQSHTGSVCVLSVRLDVENFLLFHLDYLYIDSSR